MSLGMAHKIGAEKSLFVNYITSDNDRGEQIYYYIAVRGDDMLRFYRALKAGHFNITDFGFIVASGVGDPSDDVKETIEKVYGCNHELAAKINLEDRPH